MRFSFWVAVYAAVAVALLSVALVPSQGDKDLERRRKLSAELGLLSALTTEALKAQSPDELADSLVGYRTGRSVCITEAGGARTLVGEEREPPRQPRSGQELVVEAPDGGWTVWRFKENADGSTVVASAHLGRTRGTPWRALGLCGLVTLALAGCAHAALSVRREPGAVEPRPTLRRPPVRGVVSRPGSRRALGLATGSVAGLGELARSELLKQLVGKVRRCA